MHSATHQAIDAVWRLECAKIVGGVARLVRDVGLAEELAQDALVSALEHWPVDGVPANPGAWLMATAKNRALDRLRRDKACKPSWNRSARTSRRRRRSSCRTLSTPSMRRGPTRSATTCCG